MFLAVAMFFVEPVHGVKPKPKAKSMGSNTPMPTSTAAPTKPNYNADEYLLVGVRSASCTFPNYSTIQEAVDHAQPGDTILVCPGEYEGALVNKKLHFVPYLKAHPSSGAGVDGDDSSNGGVGSAAPGKQHHHSSKSKPTPKAKPTTKVKRRPKKKAQPTSQPTGAASSMSAELAARMIYEKQQANARIESAPQKPQHLQQQQQQQTPAAAASSRSSSSMSVAEPTRKMKRFRRPTLKPLITMMDSDSSSSSMSDLSATVSMHSSKSSKSMLRSMKSNNHTGKSKKAMNGGKSHNSGSSSSDDNGNGNFGVIIVGGPMQSGGVSNEDGFVFVSGSSGSSIESFEFRCVVPQSADDANLTRAIVLLDVSELTVSENIIRSPRVGIFLESVSSSNITYNSISGITDSIMFGAYGVVLSAAPSAGASNDNELAFNKIAFAAQPDGAYPVGIFLTAPGPSQRTGEVQRNAIHDNVITFAEQLGSFFGVLLYDNAATSMVNHNDLIGNTIAGSEFGIVLWGSSDNDVEANTVHDILFVGIRLQKSQSQKAVGNTVVENIISNTEFGIACVAGSETNFIGRNKISNSGSQCDLYEAGLNNIFTANEANDVCKASTVLLSSVFQRHPPLPK
jgi:parallel beta-helix repeat protein